MQARFTHWKSLVGLGTLVFCLYGSVFAGGPSPTLPKRDDSVESRRVASCNENPYQANVDEAIRDPQVRAAIRRVQPACVELPNGSAVNLTPQGHLLTAAHVIKRLGARTTATFPDGRRYSGICIAIDQNFDLAIVKLSTNDTLPTAKISYASPAARTRVVCIGPYKVGGIAAPFSVSTGRIAGFHGDRLGPQRPLGATKHTAWTYYGHSGAPIFNEYGEIVALHNTWNSATATRHAVPCEAIVKFLGS